MRFLPMAFYLTLICLPILSATENIVPQEPIQFIKIVRTNLSSGGVYSPLTEKAPENTPSVSDFIHETGTISLTELEEDLEIRISGTLGFSSKTSPVSDHAFDMHSLGDEYLYSDVLPGTNIPILVSIESSEGSSIMSGYHNLSAALVSKTKGPKFKVHYELTYRIPLGEETDGIEDSNDLKVSIKPVSIQP